jgi:exodeoxyribonuclease V
VSHELSPDQERGRTAILNWLNSPNRKPWFFLNGSAGTGKTTCIRALLDSVRGNVLLAALTGKAALVMSRATGRPAQTLHSLIYQPKGTGGDKASIEKLTEQLKALDPLSEMAKKLDKDLKKLMSGVKPIFTLNPDSALKNAKLLVIDEISMCPLDVMQDVLSFGVPVLVQGDTFQLPPVAAKDAFKLSDADFTLTQIHRQAAESPIIRLATMAREGKRLPLGEYGICKVVKEVSPEEALSHDQILCGTHEMRIATNRKARAVMGFEGDPKPGERMICRRNNSKLGLLNGDQFIVQSYNPISKGTAIIGLANEALETRVTCHREHDHVKKNIDPWLISKYECTEWAICVTVHSSQGSQWDSVYVVDESRKFRQDASRHLYTALTRAQTRLTVRLP